MVYDLPEESLENPSNNKFEPHNMSDMDSGRPPSQPMLSPQSVSDYG